MQQEVTQLVRATEPMAVHVVALVVEYYDRTGRQPRRGEAIQLPAVRIRKRKNCHHDAARLKQSNQVRDRAITESPACTQSARSLLGIAG